MNIYDYLHRNRIAGQGPATISALAKQLGVSRQTIYWWIDRTHKPTRKHQEQLAAFGIRVAA